LRDKPRKPITPHLSPNENPDYYLDIERWEQEKNSLLSKHETK